MLSGTVIVVVDDASLRRAIQWALEGDGYAVLAYPSAEAFMPCLDEIERMDGVHCALVDVRLPGRSGLQLQDELLEHHASLPIVFLADAADVALAIEGVRRGAFNFIEKPVNEERLLTVAAGALALDANQASQRQASAALRTRLDSLTIRERQVLDLVLEGELNKTIATILGISIKTVELHRARLMDKMGARTVVHLVQIAAPLWAASHRGLARV
jgi:FixJ family two-component response regulator